MKDGARFRGHWLIEVFNNREEMKLISRSECHNIITNEGLNRILNVMLHDIAQTATWYCELFENDYTPDGSETYDVPVYTICTSYDEATRPAYVSVDSAAKSITNSASKAVFTISATKTLYGASLVSVNTKNDHTAGANNVLFCAGKFAASQPVIDNNVVNLTYTVTSADDGV